MSPNRLDKYREWDAVYVLGSLVPSERREFEEHLAGCARCRAAVAELAGLPSLLGTLSAEEAQALERGGDTRASELPRWEKRSAVGGNGCVWPLPDSCSAPARRQGP